MATQLDLWKVARLFGRELAPLGRRSHCPIRGHERRDKSFKIFVALSGDTLYKCFSCSPPYNVGDSVALYAAMGGTDRRTAWRELRERGYEVPGANREAQSSGRGPVVRKVVPLEGPKPVGVLKLDLKQWAQWRAQSFGDAEQFLAARGLDPALCRSLDVVQIDEASVGFGYRDPATGLPCRVKIRFLGEKRFRIEPHGAGHELARAQAPLYLAHTLKPERGRMGSALITEGEFDALVLRQMGFGRTVSLPDGAGSADRVDLLPLVNVAGVWLLATDADEEGDRAARSLYRRASQIGVATARVFWRKGRTTHKDANDALLAGFTAADFRACIEETSRVLGQKVA